MKVNYILFNAYLRPPQRVSVILDTGSHHTAFPCLGCNCGQHMDPFFDPEKSNTSKVFKCASKRCHFQQAYRCGYCNSKLQKCFRLALRQILRHFVIIRYLRMLYFTRHLLESSTKSSNKFWNTHCKRLEFFNLME